MNRAGEASPAETMTALARDDWPGNSRGLQNLTERAMILSAGPVLLVPLEELNLREPLGLARAVPATLAESERAPILDSLLTNYSLGAGKTFSWVP